MDVNRNERDTHRSNLEHSHAFDEMNIVFALFPCFGTRQVKPFNHDTVEDWWKELVGWSQSRMEYTS